MTWRTTGVFSVWIVFVYWNVFCHVVVLIRPVSYPIPIGRLHTLPYNFATIFLLFLHGQSTRTHVKLVFCRDMFLVSNLSKPSLCGYLVRTPLIHQFVHQWSEWHMMLGRSFKEAGSLYYIDCPLPSQTKKNTTHLRKLTWLAGKIHHEWRCISRWRWWFSICHVSFRRCSIMSRGVVTPRYSDHWWYDFEGQ